MADTQNAFAPLPASTEVKASLAHLQRVYLDTLDKTEDELGKILALSAARQAGTIIQNLDAFERKGSHIFATSQNLAILEDLTTALGQLDLPARDSAQQAWIGQALELRKALASAGPALGLDLKRTDFAKVSLELVQVASRNSFGELSDFAQLQRGQVIRLRTALADSMARGLDYRSVAKLNKDTGLQALEAIPGFRRAFSVEERAQMIGRTETVRVQTQLQDAWGDEAGLDYARSFLNYNLTKHHELCLWAESMGWAPAADFKAGPGLPPRHPGCGCNWQRGAKEWVDPGASEQLAQQFAEGIARDQIRISPDLLRKLPDRVVKAVKDAGALQVGAARKGPLQSKRPVPFEQAFAPHLLRDGRALQVGDLEAPFVEQHGEDAVQDVYRVAELALHSQATPADPAQAIEAARRDRTGMLASIRQIAEAGVLSEGELEDLRNIALEHKAAQKELGQDEGTQPGRAVRRLHRTDVPDLVEEYIGQIKSKGLSFDQFDIDDAVQWARELPRDSQRQGAAVFGKELWASLTAPKGAEKKHEQRKQGDMDFWRKCIRMSAAVALAQFGEEATVEHISLPISVHDQHDQYRELPRFQDAPSAGRFEAKHWDHEALGYYQERIEQTGRYTKAWTEQFDQLVDSSRKILGLRTALERSGQALGRTGAPLALRMLQDLESTRAQTFGIQPGPTPSLPVFAPVVQQPAAPAQQRQSLTQLPYDERRDLFISQWVTGSRQRLPVALKEAAREVFESPAIAYSRKDHRLEPDELEAARRTVTQLYDAAQSHFEEEGTTTIRLYRGVKTSYAEEGVLEAWTDDPTIAGKFGTHDVLVRDVDVKDILFGYTVPGWKHGRFGNQKEYILINGRKRYEQLADEGAIDFNPDDFGPPLGADDTPF